MERNNSFNLSTWFFFLLVLIAAPSRVEADLIVQVGAFSKAVEGGSLPQGWKPLTFPKILRHTRYETIKEESTTVVQATSEKAASGLVHEVKVDLKKYPILKWRWKVLNVIEKGNVRTKQGDDYAARIYITFEYNPDHVSVRKKIKYKAGRLLFGDIPIAAINYIWDGKAAIGTIVDNAYTDFVKMIVVESGSQFVGQFRSEERNIYEDYKKSFGEEPPMVNGVAIMTDTDNTGEKATAYYGDIVFMAQ
ncbi:MAG: DUF3047 domain-containing protein [Nitrospirota bacterium]